MTPWSQEARKPEERLTESSKLRAFETGRQAKAAGKSVRECGVAGWAYTNGKYFEWFKLGYYGHEFRSDLNDTSGMPYAEVKARQLISQAYRDIGRHSKAEAVLKPAYSSMTLKAFAAYIERVE